MKLLKADSALNMPFALSLLSCIAYNVVSPPLAHPTDMPMNALLFVLFPKLDYALQGSKWF